MSSKFTILIASLFLVACSESKNASAPAEQITQTEKYVLDTHYAHVKEELANTTDKHIVTEFFWYGCQHCEAVEYFLESWHGPRSSEVTLRQTPITTNEQAIFHAKLFFIASASDQFNALHSRLFKEVLAMKEEKDLEFQKVHFSKVFAEYGVDESQFNNQLASFKVNAQVKNATKLMLASGVRETPSLMVDGKYLILNNEIKSPNDVTDIADFLIHKIRQAR